MDERDLIEAIAPDEDGFRAQTDNEVTYTSI